ncbi:MAG: site-specific integrase [Polyangia bacterium]
MPRRQRRSSFGYVSATGTATHPSFSIRWYEGSQRRRRSGFRTKTEAVEALARVRTMLGDGTLPERRRASVSFDKVAREWLDLHSKPNLRSHDDNEERYTKHVKPFFGDTPLAAVTAARVLELRAKLQARTRTVGKGKNAETRHLAARTINLTMALVRSILRFAVSNGHIPASPTDRIGRGKLMLAVDKSKLAPPIGTAEDVGRVLEEIRKIGEETHRPVLYGLFATLAYTGLRRGEACGLRWSDVDLQRHLITVRRSYEGRTKSGKDRLVPIPAALLPILQQHRLADPWKGELVFPNEEGGICYSKNSKPGKFLELALKRCGLPRIRVHDLRHVFASHFVMSGGDIFTLQRILGHSTPQITSDTYAHLSPAHLAGAADRVSFPVPAAPARVIPFEAATTTR